MGASSNIEKMLTTKHSAQHSDISLSLVVLFLPKPTGYELCWLLVMIKNGVG